MTINTPQKTAVEVRIADATFRVGTTTQSMEKGALCGDMAAFWAQGDRLFLWLADGLGHGAMANAAAQAACVSVRGALSEGFQAIFTRCDEDIRETRGVSMGLAMIDPVAQTLSFAGIGNVRALHVEAQRHLSCSYGIIGAGFKSLFVESVPFSPGETFILASDGIPEFFEVPTTEAEAQPRCPQTLAEKILADWKVPTDDAGLLVCQWEITPCLTY